ncbi:hypothetical protein ACFQL1_15590 [Halomicroarcula sp. GCM10025709]|nr:hypothetical protein [Halomicroarcula sp. YJ-61-S]
MAINQSTTADAYRCPDCHGEITFADGTWGCTDCTYVPRHSAD